MISDSLRPYPLNLIKVGQLKEYLKNRGWNELPFARTQMLKFRSPYAIDNEYIDIFIPSSEKLADYKRAIENSIESIALFEDKAFEDILFSLLAFSDRLKSRIIEAKAGMIPLDRGIILYRGMRDLITSSAAFELDPSEKNLSRSNRAKEYASKSLIGQSEYGSYIANIFIPLDKPNRDFDFTADPFQRKVVLRILRGLQYVDQAVNENCPEPIIKNYKNGLDIKMCSALIDITDAGSGNSVTISAILEPIYAPPSDISTEFTLTPMSKHYLEQAIDEMKEQRPDKREGQWIGYPRVFDRSQAAKQGLIKLEAIDPDEGPINIFIKLNDADYQFCAKANLMKRYVQINGTLVREGKKWTLECPYGLDLVGDKPRDISHQKQILLNKFEYPKI